MRKFTKLLLFLGLFSLSSCLLNNTSIYLRRPENTNLELWITEIPSEAN